MALATASAFLLGLPQESHHATYIVPQHSVPAILSNTLAYFLIISK